MQLNRPHSQQSIILNNTYVLARDRLAPTSNNIFKLLSLVTLITFVVFQVFGQTQFREGVLHALRRSSQYGSEQNRIKLSRVIVPDFMGPPYFLYCLDES